MIQTRLKQSICALALLSCAHPLAQAGDFNFSGFMSIGGGFVDDESAPSYAGYSEEDLTFDNSLLGIQVSSDISDELSATVQLTARSFDGFDVEAEWAYVSWQATDESTVRIGRLRTPFYMYSDYLDVGYAYPWISPPNEVYYLPFNNVNGIDYYTTGTLGSFDTTMQVYFGGFTDTLNQGGMDVEAKTRNQLGFAGTLAKDWWTFRAAYHTAKLSIDLTPVGLPSSISGPASDLNNAVNSQLPPEAQHTLQSPLTIGGFADFLTHLGYNQNTDRMLIQDDTAQFLEVGVNIDTGTFVAAAEHVELRLDDETLFSDNIRQFVMVGVRTGDWLIHLTASKADDDASQISKGVAVTDQVSGTVKQLLDGLAADDPLTRDTVTLGARWDITAGTALKIQYSDVDTEGRAGQKVYAFALQTVF
ncbi:hypothetical protein DS2_08243 [Catenovulum agarivorans DS-2]|uniref:Porin domain-containing protein n=1 Tax=Catenovulum agarivorans DS-2 TaxID=1328313 RepID=W7QEU8_9ALTE|nr:hypothetical protein [Catenovulum agarivorans]EWH10446.1 hypothetical protein DS2_08243 [Catenovulum agarivorans DS-2]